MSAKARFYIPGFDGLRAISILMVFLTHLGLAKMLPQTSFWFDRVFALCSGGTGVRIFFVISGFLISLLLLRERERTGKIELVQFYLRRALRLFPALIAFLFVNLLLMVMGVFGHNYVGLLLAAVYLINFSPRIFISNELGHLWSLAVEEQFYLLWPALLTFLRVRSAVGAGLFLITAAALLLVYPPDITLDVQSPWLSQFLQLAHIDPTRYSQFFVEGRYFQTANAFYLERWLLPALGSILVGCMFAILNGRLKTLPTRPIALTLVGILFVSPLYFPFAILQAATLTQAAGVGLLALLIFRQPDMGFIKILEWPVLRYVGRISYGLYLWQGLFLTTGPGSSIWFQKFPQNVVLAIVFAMLCYQFIEKPFLKIKDRLKRA